MPVFSEVVFFFIDYGKWEAKASLA